MEGTRAVGTMAARSQEFLSNLVSRCSRVFALKINFLAAASVSFGSMRLDLW